MSKTNPIISFFFVSRLPLGAGFPTRNTPTTTVVLAAAAAMAVSPVSAQVTTDAVALAKKLGSSYADAFKKGDAKALGALFTKDAEYTVDDGETITGRLAIQARAKDLFETTEDRNIEASGRTARFITEGVLVEKGFTSTFIDDDEPDDTRYSLTYVKKGDQWLISDLQESTLPPPDEGAEALSALGWVIGKWATADKEIGATAEAAWTLDGRFISRTTKVPQDDGTTFITVEVIGYDPGPGQLRSWVFDNEGGFGGGLWRQDGNKWLIRSQATLPGGSRSSSQHVLTLVDDDRLQLETINRVLDGELLPGSDPIEILRVTDGDSTTTSSDR